MSFFTYSTFLFPILPLDGLIAAFYVNLFFEAIYGRIFDLVEFKIDGEFYQTVL